MKPLYGLYEYYPHFSDSDKLYFELWAKINPVENEIIICESCESMFDSLSFSAVEKYAVSLKRLGNESQFMQLRDFPCRIFIHGTNNDEAGLKARKRIRQNIKNKIITEHILPKGRKNANEYIRIAEFRRGILMRYLIHTCNDRLWYV